MEYIDFKKLIEALTAKPYETEWLEFKHNFHSKEEIGERISALSNSAFLCKMPFGYIVFGVDDQTHEVLGTDLYAKQKMVGSEELESWLATRLNPRIDFEIIDEFDYEDKGHVCVFKIPAATNQPVSFFHEEYVRVGTTTRKLKDFPDKEAKIWKGGQKPLEKIVLKKGLSAQEVFSLLSAETYFDHMHLPMPQDVNGFIDRFISEKLIIPDEVGYSITELGAILFAKRFSDFDGLNRKMVRVIVYKGKSKIETIREHVFDKGYAICFEELISWVNSQLPANEEIGQAFRKEVRMYPEIAVRELTANCILHQDFAEQGFPMIEIYSDRIEISNAGRPLISVERFIDEYQSRNDSLADIMRRMGVCEEKGSGMDKTIFYVELYQLPPLRLQVQENRTTVTLFSYRKLSELDKKERIAACYQHACLKYVSNEKMNNLSLRTRLGIESKNYPMASRIIKDTLDAKLIKEDNAEGTNRHNYLPYWA
ncbi:MAG: putative DNA binding domain-containing protein [Bacteroidales bacterium]|nr:putative DNA binding domain-containing protein [Bacteroidales bacterium]MDY4521381.1 putative DNA binding domain-containing protein [Bacteroidales bacterium]